MQRRTITLQVPQDAARAYEMASPEDQRRVDDALRRKLRELMKALPAAAEAPTGSTRTARQDTSTEIHPEVLKISGLVPPNVDAQADYRDYLMKKHR